MNLADIAYHEAGHAIVALDEGIELGERILCQLYLGHTLVDADASKARLLENVQVWGPKHIKMLLAGRVAQERYAEVYAHVLFASDEGWGDDDRRIMCVATEGLNWTNPEAEIDLLRSEVYRRIAEPKVWSAIDALAKELKRLRSVPGERARQIYQDHVG
jgi:hypothetical protein